MTSCADQVRGPCGKAKRGFGKGGGGASVRARFREPLRQKRPQRCTGGGGASAGASMPIRTAPSPAGGGAFAPHRGVSAPFFPTPRRCWGPSSADPDPLRAPGRPPSFLRTFAHLSRSRKPSDAFPGGIEHRLPELCLLLGQLPFPLPLGGFFCVSQVCAAGCTCKRSAPAQAGSFSARAAGFRGLLCGARVTECARESARADQCVCTRVCSCAPAKVRTLGLARKDQDTRTHVCACVIIRVPTLSVQRGVSPSTLPCCVRLSFLPLALHPSRSFTVQQVAPEATFTPSQQQFPACVDPLPPGHPRGR